METPELKQAVEALLFITDHPLPVPRLCQILGEKGQARVAAAIEEVRREHEARGAGMRLVEIAEGWQFATRAEHAPLLRKLFAERMTLRLSTAALETLAIIAYKQPITRAEIEEVRGVEVIAALETLLDRRLVRVVGRKESVGRPLLYGTTPEFLRHFGLKGLAELPSLESFQAQLQAQEGAAAPVPAGAEGSAEPALAAAVAGEPPEPGPQAPAPSGGSDA